MTVFEKTIHVGTFFVERMNNGEYRYWSVISHSPSGKTITIKAIACTDPYAYCKPFNKRLGGQR